ncbi:MAG: BMP family ABC transporter substrate-binding protein, partial [Oscillospiraceae bacterium]|nr:BMP family ABC transporter substrate-binding protein [Oscillospiraceae bacterium]
AEFIVKSGFEEDQTCYEAACDLADAGCDIVMADSFGHEPYIIQAAKEYPNVQFLHATGYQASIEQLDNFHDAFAAIYEGRYLAGVAAGLKLQEMIDADVLTEANYDADGNIKVGYIGAFTYAEVVSGYTSWFLGVRSVVPTVAMQVTFTGSWYDETAEKEAANTLISNGCALISQHADSMGAPTACETAGVPDVTYNVSTESACPNTYICYSRINWAPYYVLAVKSVLNGEAIPTDYTGTIASGSVEFGLYGAAAAEGTEAAVEAVKEKIVSGELHVFDVTTFTVDGAELVDDLVVDGYYAESSVVSAPSFAFNIDGITLLDTAF